MHTIEEIMGMIATEAVEEFGAGQESSGKPVSSENKPINYNLRLVRYEDGRMEWKDD